MVVPAFGYLWRDRVATWQLGLVAAAMIVLAAVGGRPDCRTLPVTSVWNWGLVAGCRAIVATSVVSWLLGDGRPILAAQGALTAVGLFAAWRGFYSRAYWVAAVGMTTTILLIGVALTDLFLALRREAGLLLALQVSGLLAAGCFPPAWWLELRLIGSRIRFGQPPPFGRLPSHNDSSNHVESDS